MDRVAESYQLYHGDCLEVMPTLEAGKVDAIIADWPYDSIDAEWDKAMPLDLLWEYCRYVLKPNGVITLTAQEEFAAALLLSNREEYRHKWIWVKDKCGNFINAKAGPLKITEEILVFSRNGFTTNARNRATYNPQMTRVDKYQKPLPRTERRDTSIEQIHIRPTHAPFESSPDYDGWLRYPKNILYYSVDYAGKRLHPTQKPVALMEYLILTYTNPSDLVLDNTFGSCTTGIACLNTGRRFIGIEKDPAFFEVGQNRMAKRAAEIEAERLGPIQLAIGIE